jgi:hypothetical protein
MVEVSSDKVTTRPYTQQKLKVKNWECVSSSRALTYQMQGSEFNSQCPPPPLEKGQM